MQDRKAYIHTIIRALLFMAIAAVTLIFGTVAWFASNKEVSGNNSSVTITAPKSIFIMKQESATREFLPNDTVSFGGKQLFPISTADCTNWYYMNGVSNGKAASYALAAFANEAARKAGRYQNAFEYSDKYAYSLASFVVYTDDGEVDVYLNPVNPIQVVFDNRENNELTHIDETLRIGIVANGSGNTESLLMVYAPKAESGAGNSQTQTENLFYAVNGTTASDLQTVANGTPYLLTVGGATTGDTAIGTYTAIALEDGNNLYTTGENSIKICTADTTGKTVKIYVWMEGTDAQSVVNSPQHQNYFTENVSITLNLVGIEQ